MLMDNISIVSLSIGYIVIIVCLLECCAFIFSRCLFAESTTKEFRGGALMNPLFKKSDSYPPNTCWLQQYHKEIEDIFKHSKQALNKWQPLGLWSAPRYHGKCVNIDKYNLRRTLAINKQNALQPKCRIYFFGGSHVWGWGVRDESTVPSYLLSLRDDNVMIENHGQLGYVSSQSVFALIQRLKYQPTPNVVIFLEGLNDIYSAYQCGAAGIEQNAISRKQRFEAKISEGFLGIYRKKSNIIKLIDSLFVDKELENKFDFTKTNERLANSIISAYNQNVSLINNLATVYNFKAFSLWQPTIFDKENLTFYETKLLEMVIACKPLHAAVKKVIQTDGLDPRVIDLSNFFYDLKEPIYVDPWHYNEYANLLLAKKISEIIS